MVATDSGQVLEVYSDGSFLNEGPVITEEVQEISPTDRPTVRDVHLQPDGKILFTGYLPASMGIAALDLRA